MLYINTAFHNMAINGCVDFQLLDITLKIMTISNTYSDGDLTIVFGRAT